MSGVPVSRALSALSSRSGVRLSVAALAVTALAMTLGACGSKDQPAPGAATPSAASSNSQAEAEATQKALAAYNGYREAYVTAAATADAQGTELRKYIGDPLLGDTLYFLAQMNTNGLVKTGRPTWSPTVASVNVSTAPFTVQIQDCLDSTGWSTVRKDNGQSADAPDQAKRRRVNAEAVRYDDGRWLIRKSTVDQGATC